MSWLWCEASVLLVIALGTFSSDLLLPHLLPDWFLFKHIVCYSSSCLVHSISTLVWALSSAFLHICCHCTHSVQEAVPSGFCEIVKHLPETIKCTFHLQPYHIFSDCFQDFLTCSYVVKSLDLQCPGLSFQALEACIDKNNVVSRNLS